MLKSESGTSRGAKTKTNGNRQLELICDVGWAVAHCDGDWNFRVFVARTIGGFPLRELAARAKLKWTGQPGAPSTWSASRCHRMSERGRRLFFDALERTGLLVDHYDGMREHHRETDDA